jgi:hypothetical protein
MSMTWMFCSIDVWTVVERFAARDGTDRPIPHTLRERHHRRRHPDLETDVETDLAVDLLSELDDVLRAGHVHGDRLLAVGVLAGGQHRLEVLHVVVRRCRDLDEVHLIRLGEPPEGVRTAKQLIGSDGGSTTLGLERVEVLPAGLELVGEQVREGGHPGASADESAPDLGPASSDTENAETDGGVRGRAAHGLRLDDGESYCAGGGGAEKFTAPDTASLVAHGQLPGASRGGLPGANSIQVLDCVLQFGAPANYVILKTPTFEPSLNPLTL